MYNLSSTLFVTLSPAVAGVGRTKVCNCELVGKTLAEGWLFPEALAVGDTNEKLLDGPLAKLEDAAGETNRKLLGGPVATVAAADGETNRKLLGGAVVTLAAAVGETNWKLPDEPPANSIDFNIGTDSKTVPEELGLSPLSYLTFLINDNLFSVYARYYQI